ncbi:TPA: hypothetical protein EYP13_01445, partial [Candidatus Micrarchaeota archaeon]|nr:hypothetical protein [Candidatus Micrarchaeota archaeon]
MREHLSEALRAAPGDYAEIRWEEISYSKVHFQRDQLMALESSREAGGIVRVLVNGAWGIAVFTDPDEIPGKLSEAASLARASAKHLKRKIELAPVEPVRDVIKAKLKEDPRDIPLEEKRALVQRYNELILKHSDEIVSTRVRYTDSLRRVIFANVEGTYIEQEIPDVTLLLAAVARRNGNIQQAFESLGEAAGYEFVRDREEEALEVAKRAV